MLPAIRFDGRRTLWFAVACALALGAVGCGGGGPALVDVTGTVVEGDKPADNVAIQFNPEPDSTGQPAQDVTGAQGTYKLTTRGRFGVAPGKYRVVIMRLPPPPDPSAPNADQFKDDPFMAELSSATPHGAKKKTVDTTTEYNFDREVTTEGDQVLDFDLKSGTVNKK